MAASTKKFFTFHFPADLKQYETLDDKNVCVISIIGKTPHQKSKFSIFNKVLDRDVFLGSNQDQGLIRGCYDAEKKVVILDCLSGYDINHLTSALKSASANDEWGSILYTKARVMLYALSVSHIVVCHCPGTSVDTSYIRLFRALDHARNKLHLSDEFSKCGLPKSWCSNGRPTCPRMLFVFNPMNPAAAKGWDAAQRRKMTIALEDQIYKIFRKTRIITNNPNSALFAVPSNHPFVHIMSSNENPSSKDNLMKLFDMHLAGGDPETLLSQESDSNTSFKELLLQHIDLAHGSGFDDSIGRNSAAGIFNIGKLKSWFMMASRLYSLILDSKPELAGASSSSKLPPVFSFLKSTIEVEQRFSESRCQKVMQVAEKAYQESLPEHYTEGVHETQLAKAQLVMKTSGRGAALQTYMERLKKECTNYWMNGHRLCESISLSGNHCTHELHRLPDEPIMDENEKLTCLEHSTSVSFSVACNCGKLTRNIGDPFTSKEANYTVYEDMAKNCCSNLPSLPFPVYVAPPISPHANSPAATLSPIKQATGTGSKSQTSTTASAAKPDSEAEKVSESEGANESQRHSSNLSGKMVSLSITTVSKLKQDEEDLTTISDNQSFNNSLSQGMRPETTKTDASVTDENIEPISSEDLVVDIDDNKPGYLPHMLTNTSTKGLLPDYPSWALTRLGSYSSYNSNIGLDQPGFVTSSNFLLPWEVVIKGIVKDQVPWPHVGEPTTHKQRKKMSAKRHVVDTTAKIYIGDCYTCAQGHRFMCSSPDKVTRISGGALSSKDNANKLLTMDMPLYTTCPKGESCVGQLRHIYVCTPEIESLVVSILPKIQPAPVPCPLFLPSNEGPIKLPSNGLWVLRLPHFYVDEKGHYPLPDPQSMTSCRLLKGTFSFRNTSDPLL